MKSNLFIKYHGTNPENDSEIDLVTLGNSIIGFDEVIKEVLKISKIKGSISVNATKVRPGSLVVDLVLQLAFNSTPFDSVVDLLNFLQVVDADLRQSASEFFSAINTTHRTLNDFVAKNPLDASLITGFLTYMIGRAQGQKKSINTEGLPSKYAEGLSKMIKGKKFKQALSPFIENETSSIEVSSHKSFRPEKTTIIDEQNFENYLSEDEEQILPQFLNGESYRFTGKIVGMQCTHGDSMKIRIHGLHKKYRDLVVFPEIGKNTEDYSDFYGKDKDIFLIARIERKSFYQKPRLHIEEISLQNQPIFKGK